MRNRFKLIIGAAGLAAALTACGGSESAGSVEEFCGLESRFDDIDSVDPTTEDGMARAQEILAEIEAAAPSDIKDDVGVVADAFESMSSMTGEDILEMSEDDLAELEELGEKLETAGSNVEAFIDENC
ncbi:MAG: hypothetical protein ACRBI6_21200 [Acidimicrobiales bacterium]